MRFAIAPPLALDGLNARRISWATAVPTSSCTPRMSLRSRSYLSAQRCVWSLTWMSWTLMRTRLPSRRTLPSRTYWTSRARPIWAMGLPANALGVEIAKPRNHFVGQAGAEVILSGIATEITERQDDEPCFLDTFGREMPLREIAAGRNIGVIRLGLKGDVGFGIVRWMALLEPVV